MRARAVVVIALGLLAVPAPSQARSQPVMRVVSGTALTRSYPMLQAAEAAGAGAYRPHPQSCAALVPWCDTIPVDVAPGVAGAGYLWLDVRLHGRPVRTNLDLLLYDDAAPDGPPLAEDHLTRGDRRVGLRVEFRRYDVVVVASGGAADSYTLTVAARWVALGDQAGAIARSGTELDRAALRRTISTRPAQLTPATTARRRSAPPASSPPPLPSAGSALHAVDLGRLVQVDRTSPAAAGPARWRWAWLLLPWALLAAVLLRRSRVSGR